MTMQFNVGDRIELIRGTGDQHDSVSPGTKGTVTEASPYVFRTEAYRTDAHYEVDWDNGRTLSLSCPPDQAKLLKST